MSAEYYETALDLNDNADAIRLAIKAMVVDNTPYGWTHVEDYTESSTTWTVLKCPAASSGLPEDFHVVIAHPQTAGNEVSYFVCEGYDTTNHRMKRPHFNTFQQTPTPPAGANGSVGDDNTLYRPTTGTTLAARTAGTGMTSGHSAPMRASSISSTQFVGVAFYADGINVALKASSNHAFYAGAFTSYVKEAATNDPMPVAIIGHIGLTAATDFLASTGGGATRSAMNAGLTGSHALNCAPWDNGGIVVSSQSNVANSATWDKYAANPGPYFVPFVLMRATNAGSVGSMGRLRGRLPNCLQGGWGANWGDTVDLDGDRYMHVGSTGNNYPWIYIGPVPE